MGIDWIKRIQLLTVAAAVLTAMACSRDHATKTPNSSQPGATQELPVGSAEYGGERGNGADDHWYADDHAWFADPSRTIHYCVEFDKSFGIEEAAVHSAIQSSLRRWQSYISSKNAFAGDDIALATDFESQSACDGKQDLTFYIGTQPRSLAQDLAGHKRTWAFSKLLTYDRSSHWGSGYVWLRNLKELGEYPNWDRPASLEILLTHEIGHVLGSDHVDGTIMDRDITKTAKSKYLKKPELRMKLVEIDQDIELFTSGNVLAYQGMFIDREGIFKKLTGRNANGEIRAVVKADADGVQQLVVTDADGETTFEIREIPSTLSSPKSPEPVFIIKFLGGAKSTKVLHYTANATLKTKSGESMTLLVARNNIMAGDVLEDPAGVLLSSRLTLRVQDGTDVFPIFISTY